MSEETAKGLEKDLPQEIPLDEVDALRLENLQLKGEKVLREMDLLKKQWDEQRERMKEHVKEMSQRYGVDMDLYHPVGNVARLNQPVTSLPQRPPKLEE